MELVQDKEGGTLQAEEKTWAKAKETLRQAEIFLNKKQKVTTIMENIDKLDYIE